MRDGAGTPRTARGLGVAAAVAVALTGVVTTLTTAPQPLRGLLGVPLVVWAPGFAMTAALFAPGLVSGVERAVLSVALSIAAVVLVAIALDTGGIRLSADVYAVLAYEVTLFAGTVAFVRHGAPRLPARAAEIAWPSAPALAACAGVAVLLASFLIAARATPRTTAIGGDTVLAVTSRTATRVGATVTSAEIRRTAYRLEVRGGGRTVGSARFTLQPGWMWRGAIAAPAVDQPQLLVLFREGNPRPYRRLVLSAATS